MLKSSPVHCTFNLVQFFIKNASFANHFSTTCKIRTITFFKLFVNLNFSALHGQATSKMQFLTKGRAQVKEYFYFKIISRHSRRSLRSCLIILVNVQKYIAIKMHITFILTNKSININKKKTNK